MSEPSSERSPTLEELYARVARQEDIEAIRRLKAIYARRADALMRTPSREATLAALDLFTDDAVTDYGPFGAYTGREELLRAFGHVMPSGTMWSTHYILNALIDVNGDAATGSFYLLLITQPRPPEGAPPPAALTVHGHYDETFVRTPSGWKIKSLKAALAAPVS